MVVGSVKVCHERGDILGGGEPGMDIVSCVKETSCGNGDVLNLVPIEGELEAEVDGGCSPVALGEHAVLLDLSGMLACLVLCVEIIEISCSVFLKLG